MTELNEKCSQRYSEETCNLIRKMLVKNPDERPTIDHLIQECEHILTKLKNEKPYYNNSVFKLIVSNKSSKPEITIELNKNFKRGMPDGKYIISINDENDNFHMINGKREIDFTNKNNKNRGNSVNNFKKKIDINDFSKQNINFFFEGIDKSNVEDEIKKTINKIKNEGYTIINDGKKREKPVKINHNQMTDFSENKEKNINKNNLKNETGNEININAGEITFGNDRKNNRLKYSLEGIKDIKNCLKQIMIGLDDLEFKNSLNIKINPNKVNEKQEHNKAEDLVFNSISVSGMPNKYNEKKGYNNAEDYFSVFKNHNKKKDLKKFKSSVHFSTNYSESSLQKDIKNQKSKKYKIQDLDKDINNFEKKFFYNDNDNDNNEKSNEFNE